MSVKRNQPSGKKTADHTLKVNPQRATRCSYDEKKKGDPGEFIRDRDRILGSKAFRRLAGKAQVFMTGIDDHMRTRLTHTLEVSQIARTIAAPLKLDLDLVEAIALGHDLGHTPYGHVGERTLHEIMTPQEHHVLGPGCPMNAPADPRAFAELQGFKHNLQSLVVAMKLERHYEGLGMDLTNYTLYGMKAHSGAKYKPGRISNHDALGYYDSFIERGCRNADGSDAWSLESLLVAEADEIAQYYHDVEDALLGGLITPREIVKIMKDHFEAFGIFKGLTADERKLLRRPEDHDLGEFVAFISRRLVDMLVGRIIHTASHQLNHLASVYRLTNGNFAEFRACHRPNEAPVSLIFSYQFPDGEQEVPDDFSKQVKEFQNAITRRVLSSYDIQRADAKGKYIITKIFQAYYTTPQQLPDHCVYELLATYNSMTAGDAEEKPRRESEEVLLRQEARLNGIGSIRQRFTGLFARRDDPLVEMLLMRTICNHIASMTDAYAHKVYEELYG